MHQAEGQLFRTVLVEAAEMLGLDVSPLPSRDPRQAAAVAPRVPKQRLSAGLAELDAQAGPPWAQHQKEAPLGSLLALAQASRRWGSYRRFCLWQAVAPAFCLVALKRVLSVRPRARL